MNKSGFISCYISKQVQSWFHWFCWLSYYVIRLYYIIRINGFFCWPGNHLLYGNPAQVTFRLHAAFPISILCTKLWTNFVFLSIYRHSYSYSFIDILFLNCHRCSIKRIFISGRVLRWIVINGCQRIIVGKKCFHPQVVKLRLKDL